MSSEGHRNGKNGEETTSRSPYGNKSTKNMNNELIQASEHLMRRISTNRYKVYSFEGQLKEFYMLT